MEVQTAHWQPTTGTPTLVPVPVRTSSTALSWDSVLSEAALNRGLGPVIFEFHEDARLVPTGESTDPH
jgi:hypothetical protein